VQETKSNQEAFNKTSSILFPEPQQP